MTVLQTPIPLLGSLANIIGLFLASLVSGLVGAIVLNLLDRISYIAKQLKDQSTKLIIQKKNEIIGVVHKQQFVAENKVVR